MKSVISMVFGTLGQRVGWVAEEDMPALPVAGMAVAIRAAGHPGVAYGQVYRFWPGGDDAPSGVLIYGGPDVPDDAFQLGLEEAGWQRLSDEAMESLSQAIDDTPTLAAVHEAYIVAGDPRSPDVAVLRRRLVPPDPSLPLFGQRLRLGGPEDAPEADSQIGAVCVYSGLIEPGVARVFLWMPDLGPLEPEVMVANEWQILGIPEDFDPEEFRLADRVRLALATSITFQTTRTGTQQVQDWSVSESEPVTEADYELLPLLLAENQRAAGELADLDRIVARWAVES